VLWSFGKLKRELPTDSEYISCGTLFCEGRKQAVAARNLYVKQCAGQLPRVPYRVLPLDKQYSRPKGKPSLVCRTYIMTMLSSPSLSARYKSSPSLSPWPKVPSLTAFSCSLTARAIAAGTVGGEKVRYSHVRKKLFAHLLPHCPDARATQDPIYPDPELPLHGHYVIRYSCKCTRKHPGVIPLQFSVQNVLKRSPSLARAVLWENCRSGY
jgi:hypothetical protein